MSNPDDGPFTTLLPAHHAMGNTYHFCSRCWMPLTPVRRCLCPPAPYPDDATPARVLVEHPQLRQMAATVANGRYAAVANGRYADDTATREERHLGFLRWLYDHHRVGEHVVWTYEMVDADASDVG